MFAAIRMLNKQIVIDLVLYYLASYYYSALMQPRGPSISQNLRPYNQCMSHFDRPFSKC